jgi:hypothetical protein
VTVFSTALFRARLKGPETDGFKPFLNPFPVHNLARILWIIGSGLKNWIWVHFLGKTGMHRFAGDFSTGLINSVQQDC